MNMSEMQVVMMRPDFIERNGAWLLTVIGMVITCFMSTLVYFLNEESVHRDPQMRLNMRIIEAVLHAMCYDVCTVIAPRSVKVHYQLSTNNYRDNKKRATEWALTYMLNVHGILEEAENTYQGAKKPATDGVTNAELRNARSDIRFARFGDMSEEMPTSEKLDLEDQQRRMQQAAREFDAGSEPLPVLRGVVMTSEHDLF
ncbi:MAG: hypothetical protein SGPRY_011512 [Prymnesium sp.]